MKKVLVIVNISKDESLSLAEKIDRFLKNQGIETVLYDFDGFAGEVSFSGYDLVITLGGDGTVLFAARNAVPEEIPVFPVNLGQFGFIASVQPEAWQPTLEACLKNQVVSEERSLLLLKVFRKSECVYSSLGLNDAVIFGRPGASTISLDVQYDKLPLCKLKSDGVIIATPTGSTAYSAAAGGPILSPTLNAFVFTPLNAFSLSSRPIVLGMEGKIEITVGKSRTKYYFVSVDGQEAFSLNVDDRIEVTQFDKKVKLLCATEEQFYSALRSKLNWSGGPYA
ncbi:MAG: NAD(+)/NADH kinase [Treponema sp.]|nr:NAD(+)/NADH kinase [Treponema sp.]